VLNGDPQLPLGSRLREVVLRLPKASSGPACLDVFCHPSMGADAPRG
jgi:hypothetical protein